MEKQNKKNLVSHDKGILAASKEGLVDKFARTITYLRISLTDQCNLRCQYCAPMGVGAKLQHRDLLTYEELLRIVSLAVGLGIRKVRLTGGEPLVRRGVTSFIHNLAKISGLEDIRITTNGIMLSDYAEELMAAGIKKLNISLDTLQPDRYRQITGVDSFTVVWDGIEKALAMGFSPVKLNVVVLKGVNDDELVDFARLSIDRPLQVRFIEFMPIGEGTVWTKDKYMAIAEIKKALAPLGSLERVKRGGLDGPAEIFRLPGAMGTVGFISPISNHFCDRCNRLRLTSEGKLRSCLLQDSETDLKGIIRNGATDQEIRDALVDTILNKPKGHTLRSDEVGSCHGRMSRIGG